MKKIIRSTIYCPFCGHLHIDRGEFKTRPHHTHLCTIEDGGCGKLFRLEDPEDSNIYFVGVVRKSIETEKFGI